MLHEVSKIHSGCQYGPHNMVYMVNWDIDLYMMLLSTKEWFAISPLWCIGIEFVACLYSISPYNDQEE